MARPAAGGAELTWLTRLSSALRVRQVFDRPVIELVAIECEFHCDYRARVQSRQETNGLSRG